MTSFSVKAQIMERANKYFEFFSYEEAIELYEILWQKDSLNENVAKQLAISYRLTNNSEKSELWYSKVVKSSLTTATDYLEYSRALQSNKKYEEAQIWMDKYLKSTSGSEQKQIDLDLILELRKDSSRYSIKPITANSEQSEFGVAFYKEDVVFSSAKEKTSMIKRNYKWNNQNYLRLYKSEVSKDGDLKNAVLFSGKLGTNYHDGPVCFTADGKEMFLTRNHVSSSKRAKRNEEGVVSIKLYHCTMEGDKWSTPELLSFNMEGYSTGHPALSADGKSLYFISDRPNGYGGTDLYVSTKTETDWSTPKNLGDKINTSENEMFPFADENQILYFASKGHAGLGGLDLYSIDLKKEKAEPVNMGYPINTSKDDFGLILKNGNGYFASNRIKGETYDDIYQFAILSRLIKGEVLNSETKEILGNTKVSLLNSNGEIVKTIHTTADGKFQFLISEIEDYQIKSVKENFTDGVESISTTDLSNSMEFHQSVYQVPDNKLSLEGLVVYKDDRAPVEGVLVSITNEKTNETIDYTSNSEGKFFGSLLRDQQYNLRYHKEGILSKSSKLNTSNRKGNKVYVEEVVEKVQVGKVFVLDNIFYDVNKSNIRADAAMELDKLVVLMIENPSLKIELSSHTDSRGSDVYNKSLSDRRAKEAVEYIVSKGISPDRLQAKGYGESRLINHCSNGVNCSKAEHQANRRTEVKILEL
ncbi:hypothetical protein BZG02_11105 [Labilibaculum filiforme]|uniref:OmpA-like domain-containing protein n=2 Tax=Labilibaculum filiforme TaxID=1940526 RepID=A0A2N3HXH2_9BACT|nr:hypothetical protein BZG02_11105 [Labilibaculum filiforme]